ncbi:MAG TPA: hypothetical protein VM778_07275 [Gemmatimonadota bacterium]|nr:hypothetical protein [Gemmatimonadota bacterium]
MHLDDPTLDRLRTGELEGPDRARAEAHLAVCARCAAAQEEMEAFARAVARGYAEERAAGPEPDWAARRAAVLAATASRRSAAPAWARWIPQMAAVLVAVVAVGVLVERGVRGPEEAGRFGAPAEQAPLQRAAPPGEAAPPEAPPGSRDEGPARPPVESPLGRAQAPGRPAPVPAPPAVHRDEAAPPSEAAGAEVQAGVREAEANEERPAREAVAGELLRQRRAEADADAGKAAARDAPTSPLDRYFAVGRAALAVEDSAAAGAALSLWRDTLSADGVAPTDADSAQLGSATALADSLAAFIGGPPE